MKKRKKKTIKKIFIPLTALLLISLPEISKQSTDELANKKPSKTGACYPCYYSL